MIGNDYTTAHYATALSLAGRASDDKLNLETVSMKSSLTTYLHSIFPSFRFNPVADVCDIKSVDFQSIHKALRATFKLNQAISYLKCSIQQGCNVIMKNTPA